MITKNGEQKKGGEEVQDEEDSERTAEIDNCSDGEVGESNGYNENILKVDGALTTGREDGSDGEEGGRRSTGQEEPMFSANAKASTGEHNEIVRRPGLEESDSEEDEDEASLGLTWRHAAQSVEYMCTEGGWTRRRSLGEARGGGRKRIYNDTGNNHTSDLPVKLRKVEAEATRAGSADSNVRGIAIYEGDRRRIEEDKATWKERVQGGRPLRDVGGEEAETMLMGGPGLIKGGRRSWPSQWDVCMMTKMGLTMQSRTEKRDRPKSTASGRRRRRRYIGDFRGPEFKSRSIRGEFGKRLRRFGGGIKQ